MERYKFLECECCAFMAVIPIQDDPEYLICPFCHKAKCDHGGKFVEVTREKFLNMIGE